MLLLGCGFDLVREFGGTASYLAKPRGMVKVTYATASRAYLSPVVLSLPCEMLGCSMNCCGYSPPSPAQSYPLDAALDVQTDASAVVERPGQALPYWGCLLGSQSLTRPDHAGNFPS